LKLEVLYQKLKIGRLISKVVLKAELNFLLMSFLHSTMQFTYN